MNNQFTRFQSFEAYFVSMIERKKDKCSKDHKWVPFWTQERLFSLSFFFSFVFLGQGSLDKCPFSPQIINIRGFAFWIASNNWSWIKTWINGYSLPGEIAELICLEAEYRCLTNGNFFIIHSPIQKTVAPSHDETKTPTRNTKTKDVTNPRPAFKRINSTLIPLLP